MLSLHSPHPRTRPFMPQPLLLLALFVTLAAAYLTEHYLLSNPPPTFPVETITDDLTVEWHGKQPDFDPWNRCPEDFVKRGFILLRRVATDRKTRLFLYHRGRQLLYRIDRDLIQQATVVGLHWVVSTRYNAKYRIADPRFAGGKAITQPTGTTTSTTATFDYGQAVSKRKTARGRELFASTHIKTDNCPAWRELFKLYP